MMEVRCIDRSGLARIALQQSAARPAKLLPSSDIVPLVPVARGRGISSKCARLRLGAAQKNSRGAQEALMEN